MYTLLAIVILSGQAISVTPISRYDLLMECMYDKRQMELSSPQNVVYECKGTTL